MNETIKIVEEIIRNNGDDLPLHQTVDNDKIILDRKNRIYKKVSTINIPKHDIIISRVSNEHYNGFFIFEKKIGFDQTFFLKYKGELIPITRKEWVQLENVWYGVTDEARNIKWHEDTMNIISNTMAG